MQEKDVSMRCEYREEVNTDISLLLGHMKPFLMFFGDC